MPGSPLTRNRRPSPWNASSRPARSAASSSSRPTNAPGPLAAHPIVRRNPLVARCGELERAVVSEDRALELLQVVARLEPELVSQLAPSLLVALEGIGLPPGAIEREHELTAETFPERVLDGEQLELGDERPDVPERELRVQALLEGDEPQLLEPCGLCLRPGFDGKVTQRLAVEQRECLLQRPGAYRWPLAARLFDERSEAVEVELTFFDAQEIRVPVRDDPPLARGLSAALTRRPAPSSPRCPEAALPRGHPPADRPSPGGCDG